MYYIVLMTEGTMKSLDNFPSYSDAEDVYDLYCDQYPNGWVEIVSQCDYDYAISLDK